MSQPAAISTSAPARSRAAIICLAILLFCVTATLFYRATKAGFLVYDDTTFVSRNENVKTGFNRANIVHAFTGFDEVNWEPVSTLSHILDCQFFQLKPWGHHLMNVLIHALNTALLFLVLRRLTGSIWRSLTVAMLFGWHPLRVESVAWIAERKDVLCLTFWLLATWAYVGYAEKEKSRGAMKYYALCLLLFTFGLMAKPMMVTFPFFLLLLDYWPLKRIGTENTRPDFKSLIYEKVPMLLLTAFDSAVTCLMQKQYGALDTTSPLYARVANALVSYQRYTEKFFWPTDLAVLYPLTEHWSALRLASAGIFLTGISLIAIALCRRAPWFLVGWFWYLGTLVPVIGLVQVGEQSMADRYTYIPMIGIAMLLVWGIAELCRQRGGFWWAMPLIALFVCYGTLTWKQLAFWEDSHVLFEHAVQVTQGNHVAHTILGDVYLAHGEPGTAMEHFKEALRIKPGFVPASELLKNIQCEEDIASGKQSLRQGNYDAALPQFQEAAQLRNANPDVHYSLGVIFKNKGRLAEAQKEFELALAYKPDSYQARRFLAYSLAVAGHKQDAQRQFEIAVKQHPDSFDAHSDLARAFGATGQRQESIAQLKLALQLRPGDPYTINRLAEMEAAKPADVVAPKSTP